MSWVFCSCGVFKCIHKSHLSKDDCQALVQSELSAASRSRMLPKGICASPNLFEHGNWFFGMGFYDMWKLLQRLNAVETSGLSLPIFYVGTYTSKTALSAF